MEQMQTEGMWGALSRELFSDHSAESHLETERLLLRPFCQEDDALILRISSDPGTVKYLYRWGLPGSTPQSDMEGFLGYALGEWDQSPVRVREYCIVLKATGESLGEGSVEYSETDDVAELGWILLPEHRGKGYVTEMARELIRFAFEEMAVKKVIAHCDARNAPSYRVMERLDMHLEEVEKECRPAKTVGGVMGDEMTWVISREDWEKAREK